MDFERMPLQNALGMEISDMLLSIVSEADVHDKEFSAGWLVKEIREKRIVQPMIEALEGADLSEGSDSDVLCMVVLRMLRGGAVTSSG